MTLNDAERRAVLRIRARLALIRQWRHARPVTRLACLGAAALTVANCSPQNISGGSSYDSKYGVYASRRVYQEGDPIPKGGGREMVGRPYVVAGKTYVPRESASYAREGLASWYGAAFHGRFTANGEIFDRHAIAAAHPTMPLPSYARVTNLENGRSIIVRVNDRGPYHDNRIVDLSERTAEALDFRRKGTARVRVEYVRRASPHGSDDRILLSSLRADGLPATLPAAAPTLVASADAAPGLPSQALAFSSQEPVQEPVRAQAAFASQTSQTAALPLPVSAPLPPERPHETRLVPSASAPTPLVGAASVSPRPSRPAVSGLSFAAQQNSADGLKEASAFRPVATRDVVGIDLRR